MLANNETGAIHPVADVVAIAHKHAALVHCDAIQAFGKVPVNFGLLGVDLLSISAHKLGGPQGSGALIIRDGLAMTPLIHGGGQELRRRAGTENCRHCWFRGRADEKTNDVSALRDRLKSELGDTIIVSRCGPASRTPCICPSLASGPKQRSWRSISTVLRSHRVRPAPRARLQSRMCSRLWISRHQLSRALFA